MRSVVKALFAAVLIAGATVSAAAIVTPAIADIAASKAVVDAAKANGAVGERADGYLGFVTASSDAGLRAAVDEINAGRRDVYAQAAAKNGVSVDVAGQSAFTNVIFPKLPAGDYYQNGQGAWVRK